MLPRVVPRFESKRKVFCDLADVKYRFPLVRVVFQHTYLKEEMMFGSYLVL